MILYMKIELKKVGNNLIKKYKRKDLDYICDYVKEKLRKNTKKSIDKSKKKKIDSKLKVEKIINDYTIKRKNKEKKLVICHGHTHMPKFKGYLLLDRLDIYKPNIVSNAWSDKAMEYLPKNYFDEIILERCPLGNPFAEENNQLWKNLFRILKKGGKIVCDNILELYSWNLKKTRCDMNNTEKNKIKVEVNKHIRKLGFKNPKHITKIIKGRKLEKNRGRNHLYITTMIK